MGEKEEKQEIWVWDELFSQSENRQVGGRPCDVCHSPQLSLKWLDWNTASGHEAFMATAEAPSFESRLAGGGIEVPEICKTWEGEVSYEL